MKFCSNCLYPENHPLNMTFNEEGVCAGCIVHDEKHTVDWDQRLQELKELIAPYRNSRNSFKYDCIVPVTGGKDSFYNVHLVKNVLGLNPLLVSFNRHFNTKLGIRNLLRLKDAFDCDLMQMVIKPQVMKKLVAFSLEKYGNIYWPIHIGTKTFPTQLSVKFNIPLVIWGHHQGLDQVGMFSHNHYVEMSERYHFEHDWCAHHIEEALGFQGLSEQDLFLLKYPSVEEISKVQTRGLFLGHYFKWDQTLQNKEMMDSYGFETEKQTRTFNTLDDQDCFLFNDIQDYLKVLKFGYSKATDHATREIRWNRLSRDEGLFLSSQYLYKKPQNLSLFAKWLDISNEDLNRKIENWRNQDLWAQKNSDWKLKHLPQASRDINSDELYSKINQLFPVNSISKVEEDFKIFDRGWIDEVDYSKIEDYPKLF